MLHKQVDKSHYEFSQYMTKARWCSMWHQIDELLRLAPENVLEIGPGPGLFRAVAGAFGLTVDTVDLDPELRPTYVASATALPLKDGAYSVVCAFQMLEHLPYEESLRAFDELVRVSRRHVLISLPDATTVWRYLAHIPKRGTREFFLPRPRLRRPVHRFNGEHHWEIGKRGFPLEKVVRDFTRSATLTNTYRVSENSYHRFFVFSNG
jgi:predicted SAM-dependent methyltransferase